MGYPGGHSGLINVLAERWYRFMYAVPVRGLVRSVTDLGEVAARLGAIPSLDRRGDLLWGDDCEVAPAVKWAVAVSGSASAVALSAVYARRGAGSYQLTAGDATGAGTAAITQPLGSLPAAGGLGFEAAVSLGANVDYLAMELRIYTGATLYTYGVRYDVANTALQVNASGTYTNFAVLTYGLFTGPPGWHRWKLVIDHADLVHKRFLLNDTEYDLEAHAPGSGASATLPQVGAILAAQAASAATGSIFVDDIVITQNEVDG